MVAEAQRLRALSASHVLMALQSITHLEKVKRQFTMPTVACLGHTRGNGNDRQSSQNGRATWVP